MNEIKIFENEEFGRVRTTAIDGEPWFVGKDVAEALGYKDTSDAMKKHVGDEDKLIRRFADSGQSREMYIINESGLYSLILLSKLESAKRFKHWITSEVLPSIRKHGAYMTQETIEKSLADPDFIIRLATELKEERAKRSLLQDKVEKDAPKVIFADAVSTSKTSILIGDLAKLLKQNGVDTGQKRLFNRLREDGYLIKSGNSKNMPTQKAMEMGLFEVKEGSYVDSNGCNITTKTTKVTGKGQQYFINRYLSEAGKRGDDIN